MDYKVGDEVVLKSGLTVIIEEVRKFKSFKYRTSKVMISGLEFRCFNDKDIDHVKSSDLWKALTGDKVGRN